MGELTGLKADLAQRVRLAPAHSRSAREQLRHHGDRCDKHGQERNDKRWPRADAPIHRRQWHRVAVAGAPGCSSLVLTCGRADLVDPIRRRCRNGRHHPDAAQHQQRQPQPKAPIRQPHRPHKPRIDESNRASSEGIQLLGLHGRLRVNAGVDFVWSRSSAFTRIPGLPVPAPLLETPAAGRRRTQVDANAK